VSRADAVNRNAASLPKNLPHQPLGWNIVTMYVDSGSHAMAVLYANGKNRHGNRGVLSLVTWRQREDPHWFGGRIPDAPKLVEFVESDGSGEWVSYRLFDGPAFTEDHLSPAAAAKRMKFILSLSPAWLPRSVSRGGSAE
jgi:hypothetical protein